jgi:replication-associated recombination protein RarA
VVRVRVGDGEDASARARVLEAGSDEDALARRLLLAKYERPGASDLEAWGHAALAVAFDLQPPSAG